MAMSKKELREFMDAHEGPSADAKFRSMFYSADLGVEFDGDYEWCDLCEFAMEIVDTTDILAEYAKPYESLIALNDQHEIIRRLSAGILDNQILAGVLALKLKIDKDAPFIAQAAFNKSNIAGLRGEVALIRFLIWAGFDPDAQLSEGGNGALHLMSSLRWGPGAHPRTIQLLLRNEADVDLANSNGDTPLIFMSGSTQWSNEQSEVFDCIFNAGADITKKSDEGTTALSELQKAQARHPDDRRLDFIETVMVRLDAVEAEANLKRVEKLRKKATKSR